MPGKEALGAAGGKRGLVQARGTHGGSRLSRCPDTPGFQPELKERQNSKVGRVFQGSPGSRRSVPWLQNSSGGFLSPLSLFLSSSCLACCWKPFLALSSSGEGGGSSPGWAAVGKSQDSPDFNLQLRGWKGNWKRLSLGFREVGSPWPFELVECPSL